MLEPQADIREIARVKAESAYAQLQVLVVTCDKSILSEQLPWGFRVRLCRISPRLKNQVSEAAHTGGLATQPCGVRQEYHLSDLGTLFIPDGASTTLAQMSKSEYVEWKRSNSATAMFAD